MPITYDDNYIKKSGVEEEYTQEQIKELYKCSKDPKYFLENYVKILHPDKGSIYFKLFPHQDRMMEAINNNRFVVAKTPRQYGKCVYSDSYITIRNKHTGKIEEITIEEFYSRFT
ncbi:MAG: hypothetical protein ACOCRO_03185 [Halanaerobiales bacterium]